MSEYVLYERSEPAVSTFERKLYDAVDAEEPWALVERFAELERVTGTEDERRAAEYLTDRLDALGINHERYDPELWISQPNSATVEVVSPENRRYDDSGERPAVKTVAFSNDETVEGELVYIERSNVDIMAEIDDDLDGEVAGQVVLIESVGLSIEALETLQSRDAAGVILVHPHDEEPHSGIATPVWGAVPHPDETDRVPDMTIATVSRTVGDELIDLAGREESTDVRVTADVTTDWFECPVIVADIEGRADPDEDDFVLLHGHYDSWFEGVTDNATGDAGLLEAARVLNDHRDELKRDLRVAWWPGHSTGRYAGSTWFADEFAHDLNERCVAHVDMDSPGVKGATEFEDMVVWMPEADALCRGAIDDVAGKDAQEHRPRRAGDYSFNNLGITGMFTLNSNIPQDVREDRGYHLVRGSGGNSNAWHLSTDTIEKADPDVLVRDIRIYLTVLSRLLTESVVPLDHRHTVERHREIINDYAETTGAHFDLEPIQSELADLAEAVDAFYSERSALDPADANKVIKTLSRHLVRADFVTEGQFEQDPAVHRPPYAQIKPATDLPSMEPNSDEYRFTRWALRRARNRLVDDIRSARNAVEAVR